MTNMEIVQQLEEKFFTPALQKAAQEVKDAGYNKDQAILAAANAYLNMLVPMLGGKKEALAFLRNQVQFLETQI